MKKDALQSSVKRSDCWPGSSSSLAAADPGDCVRVRTQAREPDTVAWKCATIKAHPSRVFRPALRRSLICRRWHAFRFRQIPHSRLVYRRAKRAGWIPPSQILQGPLRDAPACTLVHFSSRLEYTSDRYRLRKEERRVLPTVLLMDTFRPSRCHDWPPEKILCTPNLVNIFHGIGKYADNYSRANRRKTKCSALTSQIQS